MADVDDRWHRTVKDEDGEPVKVRTARYGQGKRWMARWRDDQGQQRKKSFAKKVDAERHAAKMAADLAAGTYVDPAAGKTTFKSYAEHWRAAQPHRPGTARTVEKNLRCHAYPVLGPRPLSAIRPSEIQAWVSGLSVSPSTARTVVMTVKAVFRAAVRDRLIASSPCDGVKLPELPRKRVQPMSAEQVEALLAEVPPHFYGLVVLGVGSGLRPGELFGLEVRHLDFLRRTVTVDQQLQNSDNRRAYVCSPKTRTSYRTVPVPEAVTNVLAAHLARFPAMAWPVPKDRPQGAPTTLELVFTGHDGAPLLRNGFMDNTWRPAASRAGLPKGAGPHIMRHTYASALIQAGLSVKVVSERLGHSDASMTLNTYTHLWPDDEDRTREVVADMLAAHVPPECPKEVSR